MLEFNPLHDETQFWSSPMFPHTNQHMIKNIFSSRLLYEVFLQAFEIPK